MLKIEVRMRFAVWWVFGFLIHLSQSLSFDEDVWCLIDNLFVMCPPISTSNSPPIDQSSPPPPQQSFDDDQVEELCLIHNSMIVACPSTLSSVSISFTTDE